MMRAVSLACLLTTSIASAGPLELEPEELRNGLVAEYRSLVDAKATLTRVDAKPAFHLGRSSPHPRIPPGFFEVTWNGVISIRDSGPITISAFVGGELSVTFDDVTVIEGRGTSDTSRVSAKQTLTRESGYYRLSIRYRSLADVPARLQLWWEGPSFAREPLPPWRLGHVAVNATPQLRSDELAELGRAVVGRFGCARCHAGAFAGMTDPPPGPSLADAGQRLGRAWLLKWLADPSKVRSDAHMPAVFSPDRAGFVERWLVADFLAGPDKKREENQPSGDFRRGRLTFLGLGCAACHFVPDMDRTEQRDVGQSALTGLADRFSAADLGAFLGNPHRRYPDGRMPRLPISPDQARDTAAYLLQWSKLSESVAEEPPTPKEIQETARRFGTRDAQSAAVTLLRDKGCSVCHTGVGESKPREIPIAANDTRGCINGKSGPRYELDEYTRKAIVAYLAIAAKEKHPSPFAARQRRLAQLGCVRCHQR